MAHLGMTFDANDVEPNAPFEVIPPGDYRAQIVQSEMRPTSAGTGQYLWLELEIIDGASQGRRLWDQLNLVNPNAQAVEIAQKTLSAICHATGQLTVTDSEQLHMKPLIVAVKVQPAGPDKHGVQRDAQNRIKGYKPTNGVAPPRPQPSATPASPPPQTAASSSQPPWRRSA